MAKRKEKRTGMILAQKMRHCFCCIFAAGFKTDLDYKDSLEDMTVVCPYFPHGDRAVEIGTNCQHFLAVKREKHI